MGVYDFCRGIEVVTHTLVGEDIAQVDEHSRYLIARQIAQLGIMRDGEAR
jgi:hypothetical protein